MFLPVGNFQNTLVQVHEILITFVMHWSTFQFFNRKIKCRSNLLRTNILSWQHEAMKRLYYGLVHNKHLQLRLFVCLIPISIHLETCKYFLLSHRRNKRKVWTCVESLQNFVDIHYGSFAAAENRIAWKFCSVSSKNVWWVTCDMSLGFVRNVSEFSAINFFMCW